MYGLATFETASKTVQRLSSKATILQAIQNNEYDKGGTNTEGGLRECYRKDSSGETGILAPGQGWDGKMTRIVMLVCGVAGCNGVSSVSGSSQQGCMLVWLRHVRSTAASTQPYQDETL